MRAGCSKTMCSVKEGATSTPRALMPLSCQHQRSPSTEMPASSGVISVRHRGSVSTSQTAERATGMSPLDTFRVWKQVTEGLYPWAAPAHRSEEHTSELQSLMRISYAVFCLK